MNLKMKVTRPYSVWKFLPRSSEKGETQPKESLSSTADIHFTQDTQYHFLYFYDKLSLTLAKDKLLGPYLLL